MCPSEWLSHQVSLAAMQGSQVEDNLPSFFKALNKSACDVQRKSTTTKSVSLIYVATLL
jgi:hypothetical protein